MFVKLIVLGIPILALSVFFFRIAKNQIQVLILITFLYFFGSWLGMRSADLIWQLNF